MSYQAPAAQARGPRSNCVHIAGAICARAWKPCRSLLVCFYLASHAVASAASPELVDRNTYDDAVRNIPFDRLTDEAQGKLWRIVSQPSLYRRLPVTRVQSDPDLYLFLIRQPEVVVNMWALMGVTKVKIRRTGDFTFDANDGAGTASQVELIYGDRETHVMLAEGNYEGPLFKRLIRGRCVLLLRTGYGRASESETEVTHQLDMFVQLDNVGAELIAKTLHPLVGQAADHNFVEATRFLGQVSQAAATRPTGMRQLAGRLTKVDAPVRDRFASLCADIYQRASKEIVQVASPGDK